MNLSMKSFLIFTLQLLLLCAFSELEVYAQQQRDLFSEHVKMALSPQSVDDVIRAETYFLEQYSKATQNENVHYAVNYLYYLGSLSSRMGDYTKSEDYLVEGLKLVDGQDPSDYFTSMRKSYYVLLGNLYQEQNNKTKAIDLYTRSFESTTSTKDSAALYNNIANVYKRYNDTVQAKIQLLKAYHLIPRLNDSLTKARILDNLGALIASNSNEGLDYMETALKIRERTNDTSEIYTSYMHLSEYYNTTGDLIKAKDYALKALDFANRLNSASYKNNALGLLVNVSTDDYAQAYKKLNDSIREAESEQKNKFALLRYDVTKKENELLKSERIKERIVLVTICIIVLFIMLYIYQKSKHKKEKLEEVYNTESRISKRIHDDVANDVFQVMTKLQHHKETDPFILDDLNELYYKTRDISKEHDVHFDDNNYEDALKELINNYSDSDTNIILKNLTQINWNKVPELHKTTIYKVLQELLINMKKHSEASIVVLSFSQVNKGVSIKYKDNGKGTMINKGTGLQITENRMQAINGSITFESEPNKGFKATLFTS